MTRSHFTGRYGLAAVLPVAAVCVMGIAGCGGHHNSSNDSAVTITATIDWPERTRDITNVSSGAVVAIITAESGDSTNGNDPIDFAPIVRSTVGSSTKAFTYLWSSPSKVSYGTRKFQIRFYNSLPSGTTNSVANSTVAAYYATLPSVGDAEVTLNVNGSNYDLGTVTMSGTVGAISFKGTTVNFGNNTVLGATATNTAGNDLVLSPGAYSYSAPDNPYFTVDAPGNVMGTGLGAPVNVTATVTSGGPTGATITVPTNITATAPVSTVVGYSQLTPLSSGILSRDTVAGSGPPAASGLAVTVTYTGYYSTAAITAGATDALNGVNTGVDSGTYTAFDSTYSSTSRALTIGDGILPAALDQAITGMLPGGTRIVAIPPTLATGISLPTAAPAGAWAIYIIKRSQ